MSVQRILHGLFLTKFQPSFTKHFIQENVLRNFANNIRKNCSKLSKMATALVLIATGSEEMEAVIAAAVLRRTDIKVTVASLGCCDTVKCSRDLVLVPDTSLNNIKTQNFDVIIIPGGLGGAKAMSESKDVAELLRRQECEGRMIAAICAGPTVLATHCIAMGKCVTSHPGVQDKLTEKYKYVDDKNVVQDGKIVTSRAPGTAIEFALKIAENLVGKDKAEEAAKQMLQPKKKQC